MKAKFYTKIVGGKKDYSKYNNQIVTILKCTNSTGWDTRYTIKFKDGTIARNIMSCELREI